ncbi:unnamed protein product [Camellia sinensis]
MARRKNHGENSPNKINTNPNGAKRGCCRTLDLYLFGFGCRLAVMSHSAEADKVESLEFKWGKKRGVGGKKKEVQFYDSFTYDDGVDYILHDCVCMYKEGEPKPYIDFELASREAIAGNAMSSAFQRTAETRNLLSQKFEWLTTNFTVLSTLDTAQYPDKMDDKVGGLEDFQFKTPGKESEKINGVPLASEKKEEAVACNQTLQPLGKNPPEEFTTPKIDGHSNHLVAKGCADLKDSLVKGKPASCAAMDSDDVPTTSGQQGTVSGDKATRYRLISDKVVIKTSMVPVSHIDVQDKIKFSKDFAALQSRLSKTHLGVNMNSIQKLTVHENDAKALVTTITSPEGKAKTGPGSGSGFLGPDKGIKSVKDTGALEDRPSKKARVDSSIKLSENKNNNGVRKASINSDGNNAKDLAATLPSGGKTKSKVASLGRDKDLRQKTDEKMTKLTKSKVSSFGPDKDLWQKTDEKMAKLSNGKLLKVSARETPGDRKTEGEVTRRPGDW